MFSIPLSHALFHILPEFLKRSMIPFFSELVHINQGPVHIIHIDIFQLHQPESLFEFQDWVEVLVREGLCGDKKLLSFASALLDHLIDGVTQGDLVVVESCSVNMSDTDLKTFFEQGYKGLFILDFVSSHTNQWKDLLVGEENSRCGLLLVFLLFFSHE